MAQLLGVSGRRDHEMYKDENELNVNIYVIWKFEYCQGLYVDSWSDLSKAVKLFISGNADLDCYEVRVLSGIGYIEVGGSFFLRTILSIVDFRAKWT